MREVAAKAKPHNHAASHRECLRERFIKAGVVQQRSTVDHTPVFGVDVEVTTQINKVSKALRFSVRDQIVTEHRKYACFKLLDSM